jgi:hypothetical protein
MPTDWDGGRDPQPYNGRPSRSRSCWLFPLIVFVLVLAILGVIY